MSKAKAENLFEAFMSLIPEHYRKVAIISMIAPVIIFAVWSSMPDSIKESFILNFLRTDPTATYSFDGVHVMEQTVYLDLSSWQNVPGSLQATTPASPAIWHYKVHARKASTINSFYHEIYTKGLTPYAVSLTHPFTYKEVPYKPLPGRENLRKFLLTVDISKVDQNAEFDLELLSVFWNSFPNPSKEWASQLIKYPTDKVIFKARLPDDKPFKNFNVESYSKLNSSVGVYTSTMPIKLSDALVSWSIDKPKTFYSYRLVWEW